MTRSKSARTWRASTSPRSISRPVRWTFSSTASTAIFHLAGQPGVRSSFGDDFDMYVRRNVLVTGRVFEAAARRRHPRRVRLVLVRLRRCGGVSDHGGRRAEADLPLRRDQALLRAARIRAWARRGPRCSRGALLHRVRAAPASRHGVYPPAGGARRRVAVPAATGTALRHGASRTSTMRSQPRSPRWSTVIRERCTTSAAVRRRR